MKDTKIEGKAGKREGTKEGYQGRKERRNE
jgi:hypothetical protein